MGLRRWFLAIIRPDSIVVKHQFPLLLYLFGSVNVHYLYKIDYLIQIVLLGILCI